jgi:DNA-binding response OmpR family regulator
MAAKRILLVEDDAHLAGLLLFVLQGAGYIVDLALTVARAERRLSDQRYGLVVADWRLPDGDGTVVADRAAALGVKTAVLTGYALQMPQERAERREIWMKPMRPSELVAAVERCIGKAGRPIS